MHTRTRWWCSWPRSHGASHARRLARTTRWVAGLGWGEVAGAAGHERSGRASWYQFGPHTQPCHIASCCMGAADQPGRQGVGASPDELQSTHTLRPHASAACPAGRPTHCMLRCAATGWLQAAAKHYADSTVFLKLFGNSNDSTKALFKERLKCRSTPTFYFFRDRE